VAFPSPGPRERGNTRAPHNALFAAPASFTMSDVEKHSQPRLKLRDVRRIFRLLAEVLRRGDDPAVWRPFMCNALLRHFAAEVVISSELYVLPTSERSVWEVVDVGWGVDGTGHDWRIENRSRETDPKVYDLVVRAEPASNAADLGGSMLPGDEDRRASIAPARPMYGGTAFMLSHVLLPHINAVDQLGVHRAHGDAPPFTAADHRLLRLLHVELGRFWRAKVLERTRDPRQSLGPRMKQTLSLLAQGRSEKEIATALEISPHTVHNYVKALHQRFGVTSRGELIAAAAAREKDFVPRLSKQVEPRGQKRKRAVSRNRVTRNLRPMSSEP
jgi:DNA-binding CsgD family transcriptional regulator